MGSTMVSFSKYLVKAAAFAALAMSDVQAATLSLKAVRRNDTPITPTNTVSAHAGDRITAEVFISGWNADVPGSQLKTYQYVVNGRDGFVRGEDCGEGFVALPCGFDLGPPILCEMNEDCPAGLAPICHSEYGVCHFPCTPNSNCNDPCDIRPGTGACPEHLPCCNLSAECVGPDHDPASFSTIDLTNPNWVFKNFQPAIVAPSFMNFADIAQGSTTITGSGPVDAGQTFYAGTICIDLLPNFCGTIIVPFIDDRKGLHTVLELNPGGIVYPMVQSLVIDSLVDCAGQPVILSSTPENCQIDARAPHAATSTTALGDTVFQLQFDRNMELVPNNRFVTYVVPTIIDGWIFPAIERVGSVVTFTLNRPIPTATGATAFPTPRWTCITYTQGDPCSNTSCWGHFPGDVDANLQNELADREALIDFFYLPTPPLHRCDMNYSGACTPLDIIEWIDMANGGGAFGPWLNTTMVACPTEGK